MMILYFLIDDVSQKHNTDCDSSRRGSSTVYKHTGFFYCSFLDLILNNRMNGLCVMDEDLVHYDYCYT